MCVMQRKEGGGGDPHLFYLHDVTKWDLQHAVQPSPFFPLFGQLLIIINV